MQYILNEEEWKELNERANDNDMHKNADTQIRINAKKYVEKHGCNVDDLCGYCDNCPIALLSEGLLYSDRYNNSCIAGRDMSFSK